jgi:glycosyltransferase involved in cell wall biosynthesis
MRVVLVTTRYPPHTGGVETHVAELATGLADRGHDVTVLTADARSADAGRRERHGAVTVRRFRGVAPGGAFHVAPGLLRGVRRAVAGGEADERTVVHAHNYHSLPLLFAALSTDGPGVGTGTPLVVTPHYHGGSASSLRDRLLSVYRLPGGWALRRADRVVAVSDWERRRLGHDFGVEATVVPNGLDVERFREAAPADPTDGRPYLLSVGRLERYKGVQHLVRALPHLDCDLVVAGSGPYAADLESVASDVGVADRVHFLGHVADADLPGLYAGAVAFATLSSFEAYGMTVAEALAAGTPCVVRQAGALVDWADRADCVGVGSEAEVRLAAVAAAVREAVRLSAPAAPLPTWDEVVDEVEGVYESVVA